MTSDWFTRLCRGLFSSSTTPNTTAALVRTSAAALQHQQQRRAATTPEWWMATSPETHYEPMACAPAVAVAARSSMLEEDGFTVLERSVLLTPSPYDDGASTSALSSALFVEPDARGRQTHDGSLLPEDLPARTDDGMILDRTTASVGDSAEFCVLAGNEDLTANDAGGERTSCEPTDLEPQTLPAPPAPPETPSIPQGGDGPSVVAKRCSRRARETAPKEASEPAARPRRSPRLARRGIRRRLDFDNVAPGTAAEAAANAILSSTCLEQPLGSTTPLPSTSATAKKRRVDGRGAARR